MRKSLIDPVKFIQGIMFDLTHSYEISLTLFPLNPINQALNIIEIC